MSEGQPLGKEFSHLDSEGRAEMVDVGAKPVVRRLATARGRIRLATETRRRIAAHEVAKGNVLTVAQIAGVQAAKRTSDWIPLCHPLQLDRIDVTLEFTDDGVEATATVGCAGRTGVEMEALTAVSAALLTIYDMCKAVDSTMELGDIRLLEKTKQESAT